MYRILLIIFILFCFVPVNAQQQDEHEPISVHETDVEMNNAIRKANESLEVFISHLKNPQEGDSNFALKVMVEDEQVVEHFWVTKIAIVGSGFEGYISNEAKTVKIVSLGQKVTFGNDIISDWSYDNNGVKQGAYTLKVLLKRMPQEEADYYKKLVGWD